MKLATEHTKAQLGAIGEHLVAIELLAKGWDAILANMSINNTQSYDIVCIKPGSTETKLIQVKTSVEKNIPIGLKLKDAITETLNKKIVGPWVFVYFEKKQDEYEPHFFVLSRTEMIELANDTNHWYINDWKDTFRKKPVSLENTCGISVKWLQGDGEEENSRHYAMRNPLTGSSENQWDKIWED